MSILTQLSSQQKERSEQGNRRVAAKILENPDLIIEITNSLTSKDNFLLGDCVEVCTMIAESEPALIAPYSNRILPLLENKNTRVRWEAMHAIALITPDVPEKIIGHWKLLEDLFTNDKSIIVRDYVVVCAGNLAACGKAYAEEVYPLLVDALSAHQTHHAKLALEGLTLGLSHLQTKKDEITDLADLFIQHPKPSIKKAALQLKKRLSS